MFKRLRNSQYAVIFACRTCNNLLNFTLTYFSYVIEKSIHKHLTLIRGTKSQKIEIEN